MYLLILGIVLALLHDNGGKFRRPSNFALAVIGGIAALALIVFVLGGANRDSASSTTDSHKAPSVSGERAEKFYGAAAREEMREYLKRNGTLHPSEADISFALKVNERLEYHAEREKTHPEEYK